MRAVWKVIGRIGGYILWIPIYIVMPFTTRTKVLVICEGEILLVQGWLGTNSWSSPGGGLHKNEIPAAGALREVQEETGIVIKKTELKPLGPMKQTRGIICKFYGYYVELQSKPELRLQKLEIVEAKWIKPASLHEVSAQQHVQLLLDAWRKQR